MTEPRTQRRLAAIMAADIAGYSRLVEADEAGTLARVRALRAELLHPKIAQYGGRIVKTTGDGTLVEFPSAVDAVSHALDVQAELARRNEGLPQATRILVRIGINVGDIVIDEESDIHGDGVNIAARVEALAEPGGIAISGAAYDHVAGKIAAAYDDLGPQTVKNISRPIRVLRVRPADEGAAASASVGADVSAPVPGFEGRPAIAVLPLANLSGDTEQEYFADGIAEDLLTRLAMWRWCPVIARNSSFTYKGKFVDIRQIGRELGARYVLEGSVRKAGDRVRVTGQLIDAETGHHVWADRYDRKLDDIFALQDEIVDAITAALVPAVGSAETQRMRLKRPADLDAWDQNLRGLASFAQFSKSGFAEARKAFERASELDPGFASPRCWLAVIGTFEGMMGWCSDPLAASREAFTHAQAAVSLNSADALAHTALCLICGQSRQYDNSLTEGQKAIELNPSLNAAHFQYGMALALNGKPEEAIHSVNRALRLNVNDPIVGIWFAGLSRAYYGARRYDEAIESARSQLIRHQCSRWAIIF